MQIGDTLYHFDTNRRVYSKPAPGSGRIWGELIYSEHFRPMKITGENRRSWLFDYGMKADKGDPRKHSFYTEQQMTDHIWQHAHKHKIIDEVQRNATPEQLREIAKIVGYEAA